MVRHDSIIFFGTGPVAAESLKNLAKNFKVELVVTKPKPAHHRGDWPVADQAEKLGLDIALAGDSHGVDDIILKRQPTSQIGVVIDFGVIISSKTIDFFPMGIINSHFSLLPRWRGADPITYAILAGDKSTGVSLMRIVPEMDAGPLIAQKIVRLDDKINASQLTHKLIVLSDKMIVEELPKYLKGTKQILPQVATGITYSRKLQKSDGVINWTKDAQMIEREIRAYSDWPRSRTILNGLELIITEADVIDQAGLPGKFTISDDELIIHCGRNSLKIIKLQPSGKKNLAVKEFLIGYKAKLDTR